jgi:hypothetical protein
LQAKENGVERASVDYPFPNLRKCCLLCGKPNCARWKGYFVRQYQCGILGSCGLIAIHAGHCKNEKRDFCYFPDFLVPGRRLARKSFEKFIDVFQKTHQIRVSIDQLLAGFESDLSLALSSAYNFLYAAIRPLRINHERLMILAPVRSSVFVYYEVPRVVLQNLFSWSDCPWTGLQEIILHPP